MKTSATVTLGAVAAFALSIAACSGGEENAPAAADSAADTSGMATMPPEGGAMAPDAGATSGATGTTGATGTAGAAGDTMGTTGSTGTTGTTGTTTQDDTRVPPTPNGGTTGTGTQGGSTTPGT